MNSEIHYIYCNAYTTIEGLVYNIHIIYKTIIYSKTVHINTVQCLCMKQNISFNKTNQSSLWNQVAYKIHHKKSLYITASMPVAMYTIKHVQNTYSILFIAKNELAYVFEKPCLNFHTINIFAGENLSVTHKNSHALITDVLIYVMYECSQLTSSFSYQHINCFML